MAVKADEIRKAKKFLENKKLSIKTVKPRIFAQVANKANVNFEKKDVRNYTFENCSLVTSIFTLQFMPRKDRFDVLQNIYNGLNHGGAFIFAEKTVCEDSRLQEMITFNFYDYKRKHFEASDILEKEKTLRNMLKPNTWKELEGMLQCAGFKTAQPFWRNHMFVGAIAIK